MTDFKAIGAVTAVIRDMLDNYLTDDIKQYYVKTLPPDTLKDQDKDVLNLFLYQVTPSISYRNADVPTRSNDGKTLVAKPQLALDLHYLLTAYTANNDQIKAQLMLGSAMLALQDNAVIPRNKIVATVENANNNTDNDLVEGSNLADQVETIKLSIQSLSLEDLTKLWSTFIQASYRLSVAYRATVVLLESKLKPKTGLPVSERRLRVFPLKQPTIDSLEPQMLEFDPAAKLTIHGRNLSGDKVVVGFSGTEIDIVNRQNISENQITTGLPTNLSAGVKKVQVIEKFLFSPTDTGHKGYESNVAALVVAPKIDSLNPTSLNQGETLTVNFKPALIQDQKLNVLIGNYVFVVDLPTEKSYYPLSSVSLTIPSSIPPQSYPVKIRIDGAESLLKNDGSPKVQITKNP